MSGRKNSKKLLFCPTAHINDCIQQIINMSGTAQNDQKFKNNLAHIDENISFIC